MEKQKVSEDNRPYAATATAKRFSSTSNIQTSFLAILISAKATWQEQGRCPSVVQEFIRTYRLRRSERRLASGTPTCSIAPVACIFPLPTNSSTSASHC